MITAYIDGGARGNPGPAGYGVHIELPDGTVEELHGGLGIATNNVAEYNGLLAALKWAVDNGHRAVHIRADSELLVKQMRGEYKVKNPVWQGLVARARVLVAQLDNVKFQHVRREQNKDADRLSNVCMDEADERLRNPPPTAAPTNTPTATVSSGLPCTLFPADNIWSRRVDALPTHTLSINYIADDVRAGGDFRPQYAGCLGHAWCQCRRDAGEVALPACA